MIFLKPTCFWLSWPSWFLRVTDASAILLRPLGQKWPEAKASHLACKCDLPSLSASVWEAHGTRMVHLRPAIIELPVHCWLLEHHMRMWPKDLRPTATDHDVLLHQSIFNSGTFPQSFCINCLQIASSALEFSTRMRKRWMDVKKTSWDTRWIRFYHSSVVDPLGSCQSAWGTGFLDILSGMSALFPSTQLQSDVERPANRLFNYISGIFMHIW